MKIRLFSLIASFLLFTFHAGAQTGLPDSLRAAILTPPPPPSPRINGPKVFGVRPGSPFMYTIPATGIRPIVFKATGLPSGLSLDSKTGRIHGTLNKKGTYEVTLEAKNEKGVNKRKFKIIVGDKIALTPPLGWNSWNCWGGSVSQEKVLSSARAMVAKGLIDHGWTYINIDDGWQGIRGGKYNAIQPNSKFPDMKGLSDEIHGMGLKMGIYSTPWAASYQVYIGSSGDNADGTYDWIKEGHEDQYHRFEAPDSVRRKLSSAMHHHGKFSFVSNDVKQWADWGVDYLKYDWHPIDVKHVAEMHKALLGQHRDIFYSLSNSANYDSASSYAALSNSWRTTGDIRDNWESMSTIGFNQDRWAPFAGPGHFNDPDMLVVGEVGWGPRLHPTNLSIAEQYTHISLWSLLSAPLLIGCNMADLDDFTLSLLTNDEVLDIDQDALVDEATKVETNGDLVVYKKKLADGTIAVGMFNRGPVKAKVTIRWSRLNIYGTQMVRDLWRQINIGKRNGSFSADVDPHGVVLVKMTPVKG
ncbi:MAG: putative Ig domain-containing protein [Bacteroidota bacterium]|nr:putative Ig domain-containing protein [Bacteroidota bacterium]